MAAPKKAAAPAAPKPAQLRRLGFVRDASTAGAEYASGLYGAVKGRLPAFVRTRAEKAEGMVAQIAAPAYDKLLAVVEEVLKFTDAKADSAILAGAGVSDRALRTIRPERVSEYAQHSRDVLLVKFQELLSALQEQGVAGTVKRTSAEVAAIPRRVYALLLDESSPAVAYSRATYKRAVELSTDRASGVYHFAVNKSQKVVDAAQARGQQAHDILVKQPLYKDAYERTGTLLGAAQESGLVKATVARIYPIVAPVYDPAFEKVEPYYKSTVNYWKPISAAA